MKKTLALGLSIIFTATVLAADNFDTNTSVLEIPDLNINNTSYGSASLKLDLNKGTFELLKLTPKTPPTQDVFTSNGYTFTQLGCKKSGTTEVTCEMQMVNNLKDRSLAVISNSGAQSILNDDLGNIYNLSRVIFGGNFVTSYTSGYWSLPTLYQNAPTKLGFIFNGVDRSAKSIPKFVIFFYEPSNSNIFGITVSNMPL